MQHTELHPQILAIMNAHSQDDTYIKTSLEKLTAPRRVELHALLSATCIRALYPPQAHELAHLSRVLYHFNRYSTADDDRVYALFYGGIAAFINEQIPNSVRLFDNMTRYLDTFVLSTRQYQLVAYMWYFVALAHAAHNQFDAARTCLAHAQTPFTQAQNINMLTALETLNSHLNNPYTENTSTTYQNLLNGVLQLLHEYLLAPAVTVPVVVPTTPKSEPVTARDTTLDLPQNHAMHRSIREAETGWSYNRLFGHYLRGASHVKIVDPYICSYSQIKNLEEFLKTVEKYTDTTDHIIVLLETSRSDTNANQQSQLIKVRDKVVKRNILFDWEYKDRKVIHDRHIIINHTRWKIILGRGLDIYQPSRFGTSTDLSQRPCRACNITYVPDF